MKVRLPHIVLLTVIVASVLNFYRLGRSATGGDEAQYALAVEHMRQSGNWLDVVPVPPAVSFQKPPLYVWLNTISYPVLSRIPGLYQPEGRYRVWSALFGIATCALTSWLAGRLFGLTCALLAGLTMATNGSFLFFHGSRWGTFDSGVTLCYLSALCLWWFRRDRWAGWIGIGVICGIQSMLKPFAGAPTFVVIIACQLLTCSGDDCVASSELQDGDAGVAATRKMCWLGPVFAGVIAIFITAPWYIAEWLRHGQTFVSEMFYFNLYQRATVGVDPKHLHGWTFYFNRTSKASPAFLLFIPSILYMLFRAIIPSTRRATWRFVACGAVGWFVLFLFSPSKADHYVFPSYPFIAIAIAGMVVEGWLWCESRSSRLNRFRTVVMGVLILGFIVIAADIVLRRVPSESYHTPISKLYHRHVHAIDRGELRAIFLDFPESQVDWRTEYDLSPGECFYLELLSRHHESLQPADHLNLSDPMIVVAPKRGDIDTRLNNEPTLERVVDQPGKKFEIWSVKAREGSR